MTDKESESLKKNTFWVIVKVSIPILFAIMSFYAWFINTQVSELKVSVKELRCEQVELLVAIERIETQLEQKSLTYNDL